MDVTFSGDGRDKMKPTMSFGGDAPKKGPEPAAQVEKVLDEACRVVEATVSIREGRQRAQYIGAEKFMSRTIDFRNAWDVANSICSSPKEAADIMSHVISSRIMREEQEIHEAIMHAHGKDNPSFVMNRSDSNPYMKAQTPADATKIASRSTGAGFVKTAF